MKVVGTLRDLWRRNPYVIALAVVAPVVFGTVFVLVSLMTGNNALRNTAPSGPQDPAVGQVQSSQAGNEQAQASLTHGSPTQSGQTQRPPPQSSEPDRQPAAVNTPRGDQDLPPQSSEQTDSTSSGEDKAPAVIPPAEPRPQLMDIVEPFDDSVFKYGIEEERGAILPILNGIVQSSGPDHTTHWELLLPSARIRADIVQVGRTWDGALGAPDNPFVIGWYSSGAAPGESGNAIMGGHRDYEDINGNVGIGVCWELINVEVGDQMIVIDDEQDIAWVYEVTEAVILDPNDRSSLRYLRRTKEPIITLITCTGAFNPKTHTYSHRFVIVGSLEATASI